MNTQRSSTILGALLGAVLAAASFGCGSKQSGPATTGGGAPEPSFQSPEGEGGAEPVFKEEAFRAEMPAASDPRPFQLPEIKRFQIGQKDKIDVYLVERHELPTVSMELNFDGGALADPKNKVGLASVCMDLMSEGTRKLDKIAFREALADLASGVESYAGDETQGVSMRSLTSSFDDTFALFVDTVLQPGLRKDEFDRAIKRRLEGLKQARGSASSVASRLSGMVLYGAAHPMGRVTTEKTYQAIRPGDCAAYHRKWIKPRGARLFVVGDLTEEQIRAAFEPVLARWRGAPARLPAPPKPRPLADARVFFVNVPGSAQTMISMMHMGPPRKASDYFATQIAGQVLGGGFASRINMNLREDKGYSYGARAGFGYNKTFGTFTAQSSVKAETTYQSVLEMLREVRGLHDGSRPPEAAELEREKEGTILAMPARFATAASTLGQFRTLVYFGLPLDYWNGYVESVNAVTEEQATAAARTHLQPDKAVLLIVGDAKALQIVRAEGSREDAPLKLASSDGGGEATQLNLDAALGEIQRALGGKKAGLVVLDADGKVLSRRKLAAAAAR